MRRKRRRDAIMNDWNTIITVGTIRVDTAHREVSVGDKTSSLTAAESKLLYLLAVNANNVCTSRHIGSYVWGIDNGEDSSLVKVYIRHLRQKIEPDPIHPIYLLTVPGVGYTLVGTAH
jgi:DNA-binding response OmpR family regulator